MRERTGNTALIVSLGLTALLGFGALAVDVGSLRFTQSRLQLAAEAGAHAGAARLDGTEDGVSGAFAEGDRLSGANLPPQIGGAAPGTEVEVGRWEDGEGFASTADADEANAVRVHVRTDTARLFFAPAAFGRREAAVGATATVVRRREGAGSAGCVLPLAIPQCLVDHYGAERIDEIELRLNPAGTDSAGWALPGSVVSASRLKAQLETCTQSGTVSVGDTLSLQSGTDASVIADVVDRMYDASTAWRTDAWGAIPPRMSGSAVGPSRYGETLEGAVLIFDGGPGYCAGTGGSFTGSATITGFAWGAIFDAKSGAGATARLRLDPATPHAVGTSAGGPDLGVVVRAPPRLVAE
ncbi:MAG: pilus assembly protein TadG-related protein [Myxococcota bacterium]